MKNKEQDLDCPFDFTSRCTLGRCDCKPKQETLEEDAKSHAIYELENNYKPTKESFKLACKRNFIRGAKWQQEQEKITTDDAYNEGFENGKHSQQERSYSEEEVFNILTKFWMWSTLHTTKEHLIKWFEQFKKEVI